MYLNIVLVFACSNDIIILISATVCKYIKLQPFNILVLTFQIKHKPTVQKVAAAGAEKSPARNHKHSRNTAITQQIC